MEVVSRAHTDENPNAANRRHDAPGRALPDCNECSKCSVRHAHVPYNRTMATFRRFTVPGATYFFTVNTYQRQPLLTETPFYDALKQSIRSVQTTHPFTIEAFVLLPDHLHCIWTPPKNDADYATRWNIIKRTVSQKTRDIISPPANSIAPTTRRVGIMATPILGTSNS